MNSNEILQQLKAYKEKAAEQYGIVRLGIFGSYAKGLATQTSDVDVVIEMQQADMFKMIHIKEELEQILGRRVDIVRNRQNMNQYLKKHLEKEALYV